MEWRKRDGTMTEEYVTSLVTFLVALIIGNCNGREETLDIIGLVAGVATAMVNTEVE